MKILIIKTGTKMLFEKWLRINERYFDASDDQIELLRNGGKTEITYKKRRYLHNGWDRSQENVVVETEFIDSVIDIKPHPNATIYHDIDTTSVHVETPGSEFWLEAKRVKKAVNLYSTNRFMGRLEDRPYTVDELIEIKKKGDKEAQQRTVKKFLKKNVLLGSLLSEIYEITDKAQRFSENEIRIPFKNNVLFISEKDDVISAWTSNCEETTIGDIKERSDIIEKVLKLVKMNVEIDKILGEI